MFRDELPDVTAQPKFKSLTRQRTVCIHNLNKRPDFIYLTFLAYLTIDPYGAAKYSITSLENVHKPQLLLRFSSSFPWITAPNDQPLHIAPEDDKLLHEDVLATPVKEDDLKWKERPKDMSISWLLKT
ncbi:hypothetical protein Tco_0684711, partial [Tanacetum coccineum]